MVPVPFRAALEGERIFQPDDVLRYRIIDLEIILQQEVRANSAVLVDLEIATCEYTCSRKPEIPEFLDVRSAELHTKFHSCIGSEFGIRDIVFEVEFLAPVIFRYIPHIAGERVSYFSLQPCAGRKADHPKTCFVSDVEDHAMA